MASISCGVSKSTTIHCGLRASSWPVNFFVRYGLLFQYDAGSPSVNREYLPCEASLRVLPRCGSEYPKECRKNSFGSALPVK